MRRKVPPLNSLIAAESASRLNSFKAASEELHVTPSAVSHQVRLLEDWLGFNLFDRSTRSIQLTESGGYYLKKISEFFDGIEALTEAELQRKGKIQILRLQTTDSFANRWLVSRLPRFQEMTADIDVRISTFEYTDGFKSSEVDVAILYGNGSWPMCDSTLLLKETIFPVCSPNICTGKQLENPRSILNYPLIQDYNLGATWKDWFSCSTKEVGLVDIETHKMGPIFNHSHLAIKSAELGNGFALASMPLVSDALKEGVLIAPFSSQIQSKSGYYFVKPYDKNNEKRSDVFFDWLISECQN